MEAAASGADIVGTSLHDTATVRPPVSAAKEEELLQRYKQSALQVFGLSSTSAQSSKSDSHKQT